MVAAIAICLSLSLAVNEYDRLGPTTFSGTVLCVLAIAFFANLVARMIGMKTTYRWIFGIFAPTILLTCWWMYETNTGNYKFSIGPGIVFVGELISFTIGTAFLELVYA